MPDPIAPGVTSEPIGAPKYRRITVHRPTTIRNPKRFEDDLAVLEEYERIQQSIATKEETPKSKPPVWKRVLKSKAADVAGKALQYSSLSEAATKIPVVGEDIEAGLDYIPGVRQAAAVATNVPAWLAAIPTGGGSLAATAGIVGAETAGAGLGAWALSDEARGGGLDIPVVPEEYESGFGAAIGGLAGGIGAARMAGTQARAAAIYAEQNIQRMEKGALNAGDVLYTADGQIFTPRRPTVDLPGEPLKWHGVSVKNPESYVHNADDLSFRLIPEDEAALRTQIFDNAQVSPGADFAELTKGNPIFDVVQVGTDPAEVASAIAKPSLVNRVDRAMEQAVPIPGWKQVYRGARAADRAVGEAVSKLVPEAAQPLVSTFARPSVAAGAYAATHPSEVKQFVKRLLDKDHAAGLKAAQTVLPAIGMDWELDVNVPDWLPVIGDEVHVDTVGIAAELFRPSNLINFTPAGTVTKAGLILKSGARLAGVKALSEIAVREGAGNAIFGALDAWANGANKEQMLQAMGISFVAGAALGVPLNMAGPVISHHIGGLQKIVDAAPNEDEAAKAILTAQKNLGVEPTSKNAQELSQSIERLQTEVTELGETPQAISSVDDLETRQGEIALRDEEPAIAPEDLSTALIGPREGAPEIPAEELPKTSYLQKKSVAAEIVQKESMKDITALVGGDKLGDTSYLIGSKQSEYRPVTNQMSIDPAVIEYSKISGESLDTIKEVMRRAGALPEDMPDFSYGGQLVERTDPAYGISGKFLLTPGARGKPGLGEGIIVNDVTMILDSAKFLMSKDNLVDDFGRPVESDIKRIFGEEYDLPEVVGYMSAATLFHEVSHRVILGHAVDFKLVMDKIREEGAAEFDALAKRFTERFRTWQQDGTLSRLEEYANDISNRGQFGQQAEVGVATANLQRTGAGDGQPAAGAIGDSSLRGSTGEGTGGLEGDIPEPTESAAGEGFVPGSERGGGDGEGGGGTAVSGQLEPPEGGGVTRLDPVEEAAPEIAKEIKPRKPSIELTSTKDYDVIESFTLASQKVPMSKAGIGKAFIEAQEKHPDKLAAPLRDINDYIDTELADDAMRKFGQGLAKSKIGKFITETLAGKSATAQQHFQKAVVAYRMLLEEGEAKKFIVMNWLRLQKLPFDELQDPQARFNTVRVPDAEGNMVVADFDDVLSNPSRYTFNENQQAFVKAVHKALADAREMMIDAGVEIHELGMGEMRGEYWIPRWVKGADGFSLEDIHGYDRPYTKKALGAKQPFQKPRKYASRAEGAAVGGKTYAHTMEALEWFLDAAYEITAQKKLMTSLEGYGISPKELVLRQVGAVELNPIATAHLKAVARLEQLTGDPKTNPADLVAAQNRVEKLQKKLDDTGGGIIKKIYKPLSAATAELRKVAKEQRQAKRELVAAQRRAKASLTGQGRKLSTRELYSMAREDARVTSVQRSYNEAKARRKAGKAGVDVQSPEEAKLERAFLKAKNDYDKLVKSKNAYRTVEGRTVEAPAVKREDIDRAYTTMVEARDKLAAENINRLRSELTDTTRKVVRELRAGREVERQMGAQPRRQTVEQARDRLDSVNEKLTAAQLNVRRVSKDMSSMLERMRNIQDVDVDAFAMANDIIPFSKDGKVAVRMLKGAPGFNGKWFPSDIANAIEEVVNDTGFTGLQAVTSVNDWARQMRASTDFGYLFIQGLPVLTNHPIAFAKAASIALQAFADPERYARWFASKAHIAIDAAPNVGGFSNSDYFTAGRGSRVKRLAESPGASPTAIGKRGIGKTIQRFTVSFDAFLDAAKLTMWEGMAPHLKTPEEKAALGRLIRNMTGTTSTARLGIGAGQRQLEALGTFSPKFTRSIWALTAQALTPGPMQLEAAKSIATLLGAATIIYAGAKIAMYEKGLTDEPFSWKDLLPYGGHDLDPTRGGRFMSIKVGDNYIGLGGSFRGAVQLLGYSLASLKHPERFLSTDSTSNDKNNPFLKYFRGRLSPVASNVYDVLAGETYIGEDTTDRAAWLSRMPDNFLPFAVQAWVETEGNTDQKMLTLAAQATGFRSFPEAPNEDLDAFVADRMQEENIGRWSELTSYQKSKFLEMYPDARNLVDKKDVKNWNEYQQINLQATKAKEALGKRWLLTQQRSGGEKIYEDDLTSKEYREEISRINDQLSAARVTLSGGDPFTGLGGEFNQTIYTPRQRLMKAYYDYVSRDKYVRSDGTIDWDTRDRLEQEFLSMISPEDQAIVDEETTGSIADPVEKRLKESRKQLEDYFNIADEVAQSLGFDSVLDVQSAPENVQKRYNKLEKTAKERWRMANPEADKLLAIWGYTSKTMAEREPRSRKGTFRIPDVTGSAIKAINTSITRI